MVKERNRYADVRAVAAALEPSYPVYCLRPEIVAESARRFIAAFPGTVLYAVKCNPHPLVLNALYRGGVRHFDTASLPEIAQICESFSDARAYFMHPVKGRAVIRTAFSVYGIEHFVVDHPDELRKVLDETRSRDLTILVRIETPPADDTLYHLSAKFGAAPSMAADLLREAAAQGCRTGVAFHVGSQCRDPSAYEAAMLLAGEVIEAAGVKTVCLDVGGGFPAEYVRMTAPPLDDYLDAIRRGAKQIRLSPTVELMAEPGRALVASGCSLLTQVQLRKGNRLYINDGIYGSLSETVQAGIELPAQALRVRGELSERHDEFVLNGPTCDSLDVIPGRVSLPDDLREGDWIEIDQVGAYSNALASRFNGFFPETFIEVLDKPPAFAKPWQQRRAG